jgi:hypothetical protein
MRLRRPEFDLRLRRRPPEVKFYTNTPGLAETYPMVPARKAVPEWWKQMPHEMPGILHNPPGAIASTVRRCPAVLEVLTTGWMMPLWMDIIVMEHGGQVVEIFTPPGAPTIATHPDSQMQTLPQYPDEAQIAFKFDLAWVVVTPRGYSLRVDPVPYEVNAPLVAIPGLVHSDVNHQFNPVFHYRLQGDGRNVIPAGTPLCYLTLVRRADQKVKASCMRDDERFMDLLWRGRGGVGITGIRLITNAYRDHVIGHSHSES